MVENITEKKISEMVSGSNLMLRASIVLGMVAAVVTILYLTPVPDQNFKSCDRPCHSLDWPMICRVKLYVESLPVNIICQDCQRNSSNCWHPYCETPVSERGVILANRQLPSPSIQVCHNDILVIDVINNIPGQSLTMHWRGQPNHEAPFMDGVPMVTQCPIPCYTTFQYKFRASSPGTHFYHAYSDADRSKGLFGALVVRQSDQIEPHRKLYDVDYKEHVLVLSEWSKIDGKPSSILINGKGNSDGGTMEIFEVTKGKRHRFRVAYAASVSDCPISLSIDSHVMKIVALDGNSIKAYEVSTFKISKGERLDFILKANQDSNSYIMRARSTCNDNALSGMGLISYGDSKNGGVNSENKLDLAKTLRKFDTTFCERTSSTICLNDVKALEKIEAELNNDDIDRQIYLGFDFKQYIGNQGGGGLSNLRFKIYRMNNLTFTYPPSPLLTQPDDVPMDLMCNEMTVPEKCEGKDVCECVHIEHIPLGSSVEIVLFDQGSDQQQHIFHLHGQQFYIVGSRYFDEPISREQVIQMDSENTLVERNLVSPVLKDTVTVPKNGVVVLRFLAKNPGFWMLRDEQSKGWTRGLDVIFQVGGLANLVTTPTNFPTCGSFVGPEFFLL